MNLPFILDVAIGLILIFLILSLLVSELQELITTILQWRARHLKESIESLLSGGIGTKDEDMVKGLVDKLYDDPLMKGINHEAKGIAGQARKLLRKMLPIDFNAVFGRNKTTGPSYMEASTFTVALMEQTGLALLAKKLIEVRLENFSARLIGVYTVEEKLEINGKYTRVITILGDQDDRLNRLWNKGRIRLIAEKNNFKNLDKDKNFQALVEEFDDIVFDFKNGENSLETSISRMEESFNTYIEQYLAVKGEDQGKTATLTGGVGRNLGALEVESEHNFEISNQNTTDSNVIDPTLFAKRLTALKKSVFGEKNERALSSDTLRPSLLEFAELLDQTSETYQEIKKSFEELVEKGHDLDHKVLDIILEELFAVNDIALIKHQLLIKYPEQLELQLKDRFLEIYRQNARRFQSVNGELSAVKKQVDHLLMINGKSCCRPNLPLSDQSKKQASISGKYRKVSAAKRKLLSQILDKMPEYQQAELIESTVNSLGEDLLFSRLSEDWFGFIDCVLDHFSNEERHRLIYKALKKLSLQEGWVLEYEAKQRAIYQNYETYKRLQIVLTQLPGSIKESFTILARRAQSRLAKTEGSVEQFRQEVAKWFDQSMARTSGVYKRNAKGVSLMLGLSIAILMNVDTLYVVSRLSNDENLRRVVTEKAITLKANGEEVNRSDEDLSNLSKFRDETNKVLQDMVLPIGWSPQNLDSQLQCSVNSESTAISQNSTNAKSSTVSKWSDFYARCLDVQIEETDTQSLKARLISNSELGLQLLKKYSAQSLHMFLGWIISGIAISMGAPFWFDLFNRAINVRNTGSKPISTTDISSQKNVTESAN